MESRVRVRFAPSPTGPLHLGGVRTALFNYLFAKKNNGTFILRIEDTDQKRFIPGAEEYIMESLEWCGMKVDEGVREGGEYGPYRQSERKSIYQKHIQDLLEKEKVYYAFDTPEEIEEKRQEYSSCGKTFMYNHAVRSRMKNSLVMSEAQTRAMIDRGVPYVVRFRVDPGEPVRVRDIIRGDLSFNPDTLDDKVLFKSDGLPTYHLANIVDDHLMEITHVIRG
ncbi:MAG TPA: glutamate--tRNA ligase, partial [Bacteroidetes bacterium]|nr:glutamate--tRNA ligase [Bacteroidota bacterium]